MQIADIIISVTHDGTWQQALTVRHGYEYNYKLFAKQVLAHSGSLPASHSYVDVDSANVVLTAVKKAEDSNSLIFRVYDWSGKGENVSLVVPPGATGAILTNLMEQQEGQPLEAKSGHVTFPVHPFEIVTVRVDYPEGAASLPK
jgi:alpha-mannosidase